MNVIISQIAPSALQSRDRKLNPVKAISICLVFVWYKSDKVRTRNGQSDYNDFAERCNTCGSSIFYHCVAMLL